MFFSDDHAIEKLKKKINKFLQSDHLYAYKSEKIRVRRYDPLGKRTEEVTKRCLEVVKDLVQPSYQLFLKGYSPRFSGLNVGRGGIVVNVYFYTCLLDFDSSGNSILMGKNSLGDEYLKQLAHQHEISEEDAFNSVRLGIIKPNKNRIWLML